MRIFFSYILLLLSVETIRAQSNDTISFSNQEQSQLINKVRNGFYRSAGLKTWRNEFSYSNIQFIYFNNTDDVYLPQLGSGDKGFGVSSNSYRKLKNNLTLWGSAFYENKRISDVVYNESLDYDVIYPYAMVDTVGGDLRSEVYHFSGGASKKFRKFSIGFDGSYTGGLAYRRRDPRPENISSTIDFSLAISKNIYKRYVASFDLTGTKYHQRNTLDFASNLGAPNIYHDAGLGAYNDLLDGTNDNAIFNGGKRGFLLSFVPMNRKGIMFTAGADQFTIRKRLSNVVEDIGKLTDYDFHTDLGYSWEQNTKLYFIKLLGNIKSRESMEANFNNRGDDVGFVKISESKRFFHDQISIGLEINREKKVQDRQLSMLLKASVINNNFKYLNPNRNLDAKNFFSSLGVKYMAPVKRNMLTAFAWVDYKRNFYIQNFWPDVSKGHVFAGMLDQMLFYYRSDYYGAGGDVRLDIPTANSLGIFVELKGAYKLYRQKLNASDINLAFGIAF